MTVLWYWLHSWSAIAFILAVFLFAFKDLKANAQIIVMTVFVLGSLTLCSWIVFQINSREKLFYYPITFSSYLKKKLLPRVAVEQNAVEQTIGMVQQSIGNAPNRRKVPKFRTVVEGIVNVFALHK